MREKRLAGLLCYSTRKRDGLGCEGEQATGRKQREGEVFLFLFSFFCFKAIFNFKFESVLGFTKVLKTKIQMHQHVCINMFLDL